MVKLHAKGGMGETEGDTGGTILRDVVLLHNSRICRAGPGSKWTFDFSSNLLARRRRVRSASEAEESDRGTIGRDPRSWHTCDLILRREAPLEHTIQSTPFSLPQRTSHVVSESS